MILYATLAKGPKLPFDWQVNSTRHFMRELNRLGVTGAIDAGGGYQNYPEDYQVIEQLAAEDQLTVRIAYNLFTQKPKEELADFQRWTGMVQPGPGQRHVPPQRRRRDAGVLGRRLRGLPRAAPRPARPRWRPSSSRVVRLLAENRWPFRLHATYDETISRALDVFERVNRDVPLTGLHWFFDHAETITPRNIDRIAALGGGIAVQHRMAFQGEYFAERYGAEATAATPPIKRDAGGRPAGRRRHRRHPRRQLQSLGLALVAGQRPHRRRPARCIPQANRLDRETALRLWTEGSAWFSTEAEPQGPHRPGPARPTSSCSATTTSRSTSRASATSSPC